MCPKERYLTTSRVGCDDDHLARRIGQHEAVKATDLPPEEQSAVCICGYPAPMAGRSPGRGEKDDSAGVGRRGFIGAGLLGAGALVVPVGSASARSGAAGVKPVRAHQGVAGAGGPIGQLPLRATFPNLPAIPVDPAGALDTLARLRIRAEQVVQAKQGLTRSFTIRGRTGTAYAFLYGGSGSATAAAARDTLAKQLREQPDRGAAALATSALHRQTHVEATACERRTALSGCATPVLDLVDDLSRRIRRRPAVPVEMGVVSRRR